MMGERGVGGVGGGFGPAEEEKGANGVSLDGGWKNLSRKIQWLDGGAATTMSSPLFCIAKYDNISWERCIYKCNVVSKDFIVALCIISNIKYKAIKKYIFSLKNKSMELMQN
jgi:hypothetical protein